MPQIDRVNSNTAHLLLHHKGGGLDSWEPEITRGGLPQERGRAVDSVVNETNHHLDFDPHKYNVHK